MFSAISPGLVHGPGGPRWSRKSRISLDREPDLLGLLVDQTNFGLDHSPVLRPVHGPNGPGPDFSNYTFYSRVNFDNCELHQLCCLFIAFNA